jgi:hypothetical protein
LPARNRSFFWFLLPSQLDAPAGNRQNSSTHPEANMDTSHAPNIISYKVLTFKHSPTHKHHTKSISSTS